MTMRTYTLHWRGRVVLRETLDLEAEGVDEADSAAVFDTLVSLSLDRDVMGPPTERALLEQKEAH